MKATAIILARGGSKGLPGKNTATVGGRPCIAWTIEAAMNARTVDRVVVSTDDGAAKLIADLMGAEVVDRPAELAGDGARVDDAARHAFGAIGEPAGPVVILYANVPVRPEDLIDRGVTLLARTGCDSVQSYAPVGKHHPWWTARLGDDGVVRPWEGEVLNHGVFRRQDLPAACVPDGGLIVCTPDALMLRRGAPDGPHAFFGVDRRGVMTGEGEVVDIDSRVDQVVADAVLGGLGGFTTESTEGTERKRRVGGDSDGALSGVTERVIGCAMRVHSALGPGLLESVYELCLADECERAGLRVRRQVALPIAFGGRVIAGALRMDLLVEDEVVIEIKAVESLKPVHEAQLLSYLRLGDHRVGLLLNFHVIRLKDGIRRLVQDPKAPLSVPSVDSVVRDPGHQA